MNLNPAMEEDELKNRFEAMIRAEHATYAAFQRPRYVQLIRRIEQVIGHKLKKESGDYRILKRFEVCNIDGQKRLMKRATGKIFVCTDELYEIIKKAHLATNQRGESKTLRELAKTYANITRDQVKAFLHLCPCQLCTRTKLQTGASNGVFEQINTVLNGTTTPAPRKRGRPRLDETVDALKCEVLLKEDDSVKFELDDCIPVEPTTLFNGHPHSFSIGDTNRPAMDEPPEGFASNGFGAWLQQLAECQQQLLYVESRRLDLEEVRLQVDQQIAANLKEIVNHLKQPNDKIKIEQP